jgi:hypothetical protein
MQWRSRWVLVGLLGVVAAGVSAWVWRRYSTLESLNALWALFSGLVAVMTPFVVWARRGRPATPPGADPDTAVDMAAERLAAAVAQQWRDEERLRRLQDPWPLPVRWINTGRPVADHWQAIHGVPGRDEQLELSGTLDEIVEVFHRVPSRRLVILGEPGAGKTIIALRLVLGLLDRRQPGYRVPVLLSVASWNPAQAPLGAWIAQRLAEDYPSLRIRTASGSTLAWEVVTSGRVLPVLDGLDEIPQPLHREVLVALNRALLPDDPLVITCRAREYQQAITTAGDVLTAAAVIELCPLQPKDLQAYLRVTTAQGRADKWNETFSELGDHPDGPVAQALGTPLMAWLARTAYSDSPSDPGELVATDDDGNRLLNDRAAVEGRLLDRLLPVVYAQDPQGQSRDRWTAQQAQRWLTYLAMYLHRLGSRDLAWWQLYQTVPRLVFGLVGGLAYGLAASLAGGLVGGLGHGLVGSPAYRLAGGPGFGFTAGFLGGLLFALMFGLADRLRRWPDPARVQISTREIIKPFLWRFGFGLMIGLAAWFAFGPVFGLTGGLVFGLARSPGPAQVQISLRGIAKPFLWRFGFGLVWGLVVGLVFGLSSWGVAAGLAVGLAILLTVWIDAPADTARVTSPADMLRLDRAASFLFGLAAGFAGALMFALAGGFAGGLALAGGLVGGFLGGFMIGLTGAQGRLVASQAWMALTGHLPWALMAFLADAHRRGVLRQVGGVYQFRHARLQDRLVAHATNGGCDSVADLEPIILPEDHP